MALKQYGLFKREVGVQPLNRVSGRSRGGARTILVLIVFVVGLLCGAILTHNLLQGEEQRRERAHGSPVPSAAAQDSGAPLDSAGLRRLPARPADETGSESSEVAFLSRRNAVVAAAERVGPAVVSISVTQVRYVRGNPFAGSADPLERWFGMFYRGIRPQEISSLGSGVIIDDRGIVVTNEHVVRDAKEIKVSLSDGRTMDATVVGSDVGYDLAVLRIPDEDLPVAPVGTSDDLVVGEWAIALGNPFGFLLNNYQPTVTAGVISATNRDMKPDPDTKVFYKDMIQTDASINPGNSGGPLVNGLGEVIGINTFIFTQGGGSLGIGFAIPINTVIRVVREILAYGRVRHVWIGITVQEISQMLANYFRIRDRRGLLVWSVDEGSPAGRAGIRVGDIIREVNGQPVASAVEAQQRIFGATIGDLLRLKMERDGQYSDVEILLEEAPDEGGSR